LITSPNRLAPSSLAVSQGAFQNLHSGIVYFTEPIFRPERHSPADRAFDIFRKIMASLSLPRRKMNRMAPGMLLSFRLIPHRSAAGHGTVD
jgi:hypothetical protein